jgi:hypothetical protein
MDQVEASLGRTHELDMGCLVPKILKYIFEYVCVEGHCISYMRYADAYMDFYAELYMWSKHKILVFFTY